MRKELLSLFLIWTILFVSIGVSGISAQTDSKDSIKTIKLSKAENNGLRKVFEKQTNSTVANALDTPINFDEIEKIDLNKKLPKRKMSAKRKAMWVAIVAGIAVGMFFLIKYAKECEIYEDYCPPDETICPCLKYKEDEK